MVPHYSKTLLIQYHLIQNTGSFKTNAFTQLEV